LSALPFTFPCDVNQSFEENEPLHAIAMNFCQKCVPLCRACYVHLHHAR
jgi:hypothetical protein